MVLEATLTCVDNSDYSRNGDCQPSRIEAQQDAVNMICGHKTNQNPESCVGVLTMAGERVHVDVPPTQDLGRILQVLHDVRVGGACDMKRALYTAQLALKHRVNKSQRQRIVLFVASPIAEDEKTLDGLGKRLKKNGVALDIVSVGDVESNHAKVEALYNAVKQESAENKSHLVEVAGDQGLLSEVISRSPILREGAESSGGGGAATGDGAGSGDLIAGVDASTDPELYMALRMSLEEEQARQQRAAAAAAGAAETAAGAPLVTPGDVDQPPVIIPGTTEPVLEFMSDRQPSTQEIDAMEGIDADLRAALLMSIQNIDETTAPSEPPPEPIGELAALVGNLPGVDLHNPALRDALRAAQEREEAEQAGKEDEEMKEATTDPKDKPEGGAPAS